MWFQIFFSIICIIAAVVITAFIVRNNRNYDGKTPLGWWIVGIGISQICVVESLTVWWVDWWRAHLWILSVSTGITIISVILAIVVKVKTK